MIENARIAGTMLGVEDHGIMTCFLYLEFDSNSQGFGGYALDDWDAERKVRVGSAYGTEFIRRILTTLGVEKWEDLKGKHCRAERDLGKIHRIGHIVKDVWFDPTEIPV